VCAEFFLRGCFPKLSVKEMFLLLLPLCSHNSSVGPKGPAESQVFIYLAAGTNGTYGILVIFLTPPSSETETVNVDETCRHVFLLVPWCMASFLPPFPLIGVVGFFSRFSKGSPPLREY